MTYRDPGSGFRPTKPNSTEHQRLAFEADFDGDRRPQLQVDQDPCDPGRYWDIFSTGTD